jgi:hypothetical protein
MFMEMYLAICGFANHAAAQVMYRRMRAISVNCTGNYYWRKSFGYSLTYYTTISCGGTIENPVKTSSNITGFLD